jgi:hypothetical protein
MVAPATSVTKAAAIMEMLFLDFICIFGTIQLPSFS